MTRTRVELNSIYRAVMPYSEVCMHMRIAGKEMYLRLISDRAVQLYDPRTGDPFSFPVLPGEAGLYSDDLGFYVYGDLLISGLKEMTR